MNTDAAALAAREFLARRSEPVVIVRRVDGATREMLRAAHLTDHVLPHLPARRWGAEPPQEPCRICTPQLQGSTVQLSIHTFTVYVMLG